MPIQNQLVIGKLINNPPPLQDWKDLSLKSNPFQEEDLLLSSCPGIRVYNDCILGPAVNCSLVKLISLLLNNNNNSCENWILKTIDWVVVLPCLQLQYTNHCLLLLCHCSLCWRMHHDSCPASWPPPWTGPSSWARRWPRTWSSLTLVCWLAVAVEALLSHPRLGGVAVAGAGQDSSHGRVTRGAGGHWARSWLGWPRWPGQCVPVTGCHTGHHSPRHTAHHSHNVSHRWERVWGGVETWNSNNNESTEQWHYCIGLTWSRETPWCWHDWNHGPLMTSPRRCPMILWSRWTSLDRIHHSQSPGLGRESVERCRSHFFGCHCSGHHWREREERGRGSSRGTGGHGRRTSWWVSWGWPWSRRWSWWQHSWLGGHLRWGWPPQTWTHAHHHHRPGSAPDMAAPHLSSGSLWSVSSWGQCSTEQSCHGDPGTWWRPCCPRSGTCQHTDPAHGQWSLEPRGSHLCRVRWRTCSWRVCHCWRSCSASWSSSIAWPGPLGEPCWHPADTLLTMIGLLRWDLKHEERWVAGTQKGTHTEIQFSTQQVFPHSWQSQSSFSSGE